MRFNLYNFWLNKVKALGYINCTENLAKYGALTLKYRKMFSIKNKLKLFCIYLLVPYVIDNYHTFI